MVRDCGKRCLLCGAEIKRSVWTTAGRQGILCEECIREIAPTVMGGRLTQAHQGTAQCHRCSFCGKPVDEVRSLIVADWVAICDECVWICVRILVAEYEKHLTTGREEDRPPPRGEEPDGPDASDDKG